MAITMQILSEIFGKLKIETVSMLVGGFGGRQILVCIGVQEGGEGTVLVELFF